MHIPSGQTKDMQILGFDDAVKLSGKGDIYDTGLWLYVPDFYTEYRYILGTKGSYPLICIGINPSTAEPGNLDNTLKSVARIAAGNSFDSWMMFNVYAQRATDPDNMDREMNKELHSANMEAFRYILSNVKGGRPCVWAAWGTIIEKRNYLPDCVRDMVKIGCEYDARWVCAGKCSAKGHPHHPLYLRRDERICDFDIDSYLRGLK